MEDDAYLCNEIYGFICIFIGVSVQIESLKFIVGVHNYSYPKLNLNPEITFYKMFEILKSLTKLKNVVNMKFKILLRFYKEFCFIIKCFMCFYFAM